MQSRPASLALALSLVSTLACGDSGGRVDGNADEIDGGLTTGDGTADGSTDDEVGESAESSESNDTSSSSDSSSESESESNSDTASESETNDSSDGESTTGDPCEGMNDLPVQKLIWIANSGQGTVSKINTETGVEIGRYIVRPDSAGSPSRTSVNRYGDVAVANRNGGVTKVYGSEINCQDTNGELGIQTSSGAADIRPWGSDECLAWYRELPHGDNRPVAWTNGVFNEQTCEYDDLDVWTAWSDWAPGTTVVALLDGDDGSVIQEVPIPDLPQPWPGWYGFYGAAVDAEDNVWLSQLQGSNPQQSWLVRVNRDDFTYDAFPVPDEGGYGMTVTSEGYVWICGRTTRRFNPQTQQWTNVPLAPNGSVHTGGCMGDGNGLLYRGTYGQVHGINTLTMEVAKVLDVGQPGDDFIWGVAVDFDGYVWAVPRNSSRAYKVDPATNTIVATVEGLVSAYTYSDMTGFALLNVNPG